MALTPATYKLINLPKLEDLRGNLSFIEEENHIPFKIKRTYWIYDVPGGEKRDGHAHKSHHEFIVALSGSFDVLLDNGSENFTCSLNRSYYGLYLPNMMWRSLQNFSTNSLCLILASEEYDVNDYVYEYQTFKKLIND